MGLNTQIGFQGTYFRSILIVCATWTVVFLVLSPGPWKSLPWYLFLGFVGFLFAFFIGAIGYGLIYRVLVFHDVSLEKSHEGVNAILYVSSSDKQQVAIPLPKTEIPRVPVSDAKAFLSRWKGYRKYCKKYPVHGEVLTAIAQVLLAYPDLRASHIEGRHGGHSLAKHSLHVLLVADKLVRIFRYRGTMWKDQMLVQADGDGYSLTGDPVLPLAALAHDIGKIVAYTVRDGKTIKVLPVHDSVGRKVLLSLPEIYEISILDRNALLMSVGYYHHIVGGEINGMYYSGIPIAPWVPDRIRALAHFLEYADIQAGRIEAGEQVELPPSIYRETGVSFSKSRDREAAHVSGGTQEADLSGDEKEETVRVAGVGPSNAPEATEVSGEGGHQDPPMDVSEEEQGEELSGGVQADGDVEGDLSAGGGVQEAAGGGFSVDGDEGPVQGVAYPAVMEEEAAPLSWFLEYLEAVRRKKEGARGHLYGKHVFIDEADWLYWLYANGKPFLFPEILLRPAREGYIVEVTLQLLEQLSRRGVLLLESEGRAYPPSMALYHVDVYGKNDKLLQPRKRTIVVSKQVSFDAAECPGSTYRLEVKGSVFEGEPKIDDAGPDGEDFARWLWIMQTVRPFREKKNNDGQMCIVLNINDIPEYFRKVDFGLLDVVRSPKNPDDMAFFKNTVCQVAGMDKRPNLPYYLGTRIG